MKLDEPLPARFGASRVAVFELSVVGFLVAHEHRYAPGEEHPLTVQWNGENIELVCRMIRSTLWRLTRSIGEPSVYHSGLQITETIGDSYNRLREMIYDRIVRALEEQKANAHGIPPLSAYMYQPEKGDLFRRCELIDSRWRKTETVHSEQPPNGFTISAEVMPAYVEMLCRTWEITTTEGRRLTQMLAELSINKKEGIPTRRYVP